jgi:tRNA 2-thiouridine synthesizing protein A
MSGYPQERDCWDAGELGCGELVMLLRRRLRQMPGGVLKVIAHDPAAPIDIGAWCQMTSNELLASDAGTHSFWIRSKTTWN